MTLGLKSKSSKFADWKATFLSVIPAQAGIQVFLGLAAASEDGCRLSPA